MKWKNKGWGVVEDNSDRENSGRRMHRRSLPQDRTRQWCHQGLGPGRWVSYAGPMKIMKQYHSIRITMDWLHEKSSSLIRVSNLESLPASVEAFLRSVELARQKAEMQSWLGSSGYTNRLWHKCSKCFEILYRRLANSNSHRSNGLPEVMQDE